MHILFTALCMSIALQKLNNISFFSLNKRYQLLNSDPFVLLGPSKVFISCSVIEQLQDQQIIFDKKVFDKNKHTCIIVKDYIFKSLRHGTVMRVFAGTVTSQICLLFNERI